MSSYRVNYGNGQVNYAGSKAECIRHIKLVGDGFAFLQRRDPETGEWFRARGAA